MRILMRLLIVISFPVWFGPFLLWFILWGLARRIWAGFSPVVGYIKTGEWDDAQ